MRVLAIGDIHGYLQKLQALIEKVCPTDDDLVVYLGDYIDRGPDSPGVIDFLMAFREKYPKTIFLGGNHDHLLVFMLQLNGLLPRPKDTEVGACLAAKEYGVIGEVPPLKSSFQRTFYDCGGQTTVQQYGGLSRIPIAHREFLANCQLYYEHETDGQSFIFTHAGVYPGIPMDKQRPEDLLWIRSDFYDADSTDFGLGGKTIVHGHDPYLRIGANTRYRINVDTGVHLSVLGGKLSCCDVLTRTYWQA